jgi:excisionase family DNA binding protein
MAGDEAAVGAAVHQTSRGTRMISDPSRILGELDKLIVKAVPEVRPSLVVALAARLAQLGAVLAVPTEKGNGSTAPAVEDRLLTMPEAAERLGITEHQAREMGRRGELPVVTVGKRFVRVRIGTLEDWIRQREGATLSGARRR